MTPDPLTRYHGYPVHSEIGVRDIAAEIARRWRYVLFGTVALTVVLCGFAWLLFAVAG